MSLPTTQNSVATGKLKYPSLLLGGHAADSRMKLLLPKRPGTPLRGLQGPRCPRVGWRFRRIRTYLNYPYKTKRLNLPGNAGFLHTRPSIQDQQHQRCRRHPNRARLLRYARFGEDRPQGRFPRSVDRCWTYRSHDGSVLVRIADHESSRDI